MKIDKKFLKKVVKILLNKLPNDETVLIKALDNLLTIQTLFRKDKTFRNFLLNPAISINEKEKAIDVISKELGLDDTVKKALEFIVKNNRGNVLKHIGDEFKFEVEKLFSTVKGEIITAYPVDMDTLENIKATVEKKLGKKVEFEVKQDPSIIGGVVIKAGSYILDASIKNYLQKLKQQLTQY